MRKYLMLTMALGALIAVSVAGIATGANNKPVTVEAGNLVFTFNGGFSPTKTAEEQARADQPHRLGQDLDQGRHPPAGAERNARRNRQERRHQRQGPARSASRASCSPATPRPPKKPARARSSAPGKTTVEIQFPEQKPIDVNSKLLVFNGGFSGGTTTLYIHAYFTAPVTGAIVTTLKIKKVHNGRYGLKTVATIPKIAGGSGSVKTFNLTINKEGRPYRQMPRRQAAGEGHGDLLRRHQSLGRDHPYLHRHLRNATRGPASST